MNRLRETMRHATVPVKLMAGLMLAVASPLFLPALQQSGTAQSDRTPVNQFQEAVTLMETRGDCAAAIKLFEQVGSSSDRRLAASAVLYQGICYERLGRQEAERMYRQVLALFPDQGNVAQEARKRLAALPRPAAASSTTLVNRKAWAKEPDGIASSVSFDGRMIAFRTNDEFTFADASTATMVRRIHMKRDAATEWGQIWDPVVLSPDGSEAAFTFERPDGAYELRVMRSDTGEYRIVDRAPKEEFLSAGEWSLPQRLLVRRALPDGRLRVLAISPADGSTQADIELPSAPYGESISPDGLYLVYDAPSEQEQEDRDVFLRDTRGGPPVLLAGGASDDLAPRWTADGARVLFASDRTGTQALWMIEVDGGVPASPPRMLYSDAGLSVLSLGLTKSGTYYYMRQIGLADVYVVNLDDRGVPSSTPAPAARRFLGTNIGSSWGPDNTLVYNAREGSTLTTYLAIRNADRGIDRLVNTGMRFLRFARWSPDGHAILVKGGDSQRRYGIYLVDPESGRTQPVMQVPPADESTIGAIGWAADSQSILYVQSSKLISRAITTGVERVILGRELESGARIGAFDVLASTEAIALVEYRGFGASLRSTLGLLNRDGTTRVLAETSAPYSFEWPAWMPDGRSVLVVRRGGRASASTADEAPSVWRVSVTGGTPEPLGLSMAALRNIGVSRNGQHLAFTAGAITREEWVLENVVPPLKHKPL